MYLMRSRNLQSKAEKELGEVSDGATEEGPNGPTVSTWSLTLREAGRLW